jgi:hypothetical protein
MSTQIKIFCSDSIYTLEKDLNRWLASNPVTILHLSHVISPNAWHHVMLTFEAKITQTSQEL